MIYKIDFAGNVEESDKSKRLDSLGCKGVRLAKSLSGLLFVASDLTKQIYATIGIL
jgi:hypothetical protein